MKIASRVTPEGLAGHMWPAGHGLSTTGVSHQRGWKVGHSKVGLIYRLCT